jgi:hypothetical protein
MSRKKNRFQYKSIARDIGRAKAFERPAQDLARAMQAPGRMPTELETGSDVEDIRDLIRTHIARGDDIGFDHLFWEADPPAHTDPVNTWNRLIGRVQVPIGQVMVLQQYLFFAEIDHTPAIAQPVMAEPTELFFQFVFKLFENARPLQQATWYGNLFGPFPNLQWAGYSVLSKSIADDSDWDSAGNSLIIRGGASLNIYAERITNIAPYRQLATVGCRIRGFFVQQTGEKGARR